MDILKGRIDITSDLNALRSIPDSIKIISLDEGNSISPSNPNVIVGTCLLPPPEALIAEADGDINSYRYFYINYLSTPFVDKFIGAMIGALYKGISLVVYIPYSLMQETIIVQSFRECMDRLYGIHIGILGLEPHFYNQAFIPIWLTKMYMADVISPRDYLYLMPEARIGSDVMDKLIFDIKPMGNSYNERVKSVVDFRLKLKKNYKTNKLLRDLRIGG